MTHHLYDTDKIDQLIIRYGRADSADKKERIKEWLFDETIGTVYVEDNMKEPKFFSGLPRLAALIRAHKRHDDPNLLKHIEQEIEFIQSGSLLPVAEFDQMPFPFASCTNLLAVAERFDDRSVSRYFRLRAFQAHGVFMDTAIPKNRGGEDAELTDKEWEYLNSI